MRREFTYKINDIEKFKIKFLYWANQFEYVAYLDSNQYYNKNKSDVDYHDFEIIAGVDCIKEIELTEKQCFGSLKKLINQDWLFGYLNYDLKNEIENLSSNNFDGAKIPLINFFVPRYVFIIENDFVKILYNSTISNEKEMEDIVQEINNQTIENQPTDNIEIKSKITHQNYIETIKKIKHQIQIGNIYEINFCQEFYANNVKINPVNLFFKLITISPTPFSCFYKHRNNYLLCASPERFIKKKGNKIISQPIKGTIKRGTTTEEDNLLKSQLKTDIKEQAENTMIVDLVRNDLSKTAVKSSVKVEELMGVYTFKQVHQLISTITSELNPEFDLVDLIKSMFPMGSMTGTPKVKAMQLIEEFESTKRGIYSGSVGYITPNADFDFNVVIRSIIYNQTDQYLSYTVGGAITNYSDPQKEYEECLLKAKAIEKAITQ